MKFECLPFLPTMENEKLTYVKGIELPPIEWLRKDHNWRNEKV